MADWQTILDSVINDDAAENDGAQRAWAFLGAGNNSGTNGVALVELDDDTLRVDAWAFGLEPGTEHPFHIHGFEDDRASELPTLAQDTDTDGVLEGPEGEPVFGPVLLSLTTEGEPARAVADAAFPIADENGVIHYEQVFEFDRDDPDDAAILEDLEARLEGRGIQLHGLTVPEGEGADTPHEVNGTGGYVETLPIANGLLQDVPDWLNTDQVRLIANALTDGTDPFAM